MSPTIKKSRKKAFLGDMVTFYNTFKTWDMDPQEIATDALWELKDIETLTDRSVRLVDRSHWICVDAALAKSFLLSLGTWWLL